MNDLEKRWKTRIALVEKAIGLVAICQDEKIAYLNEAGAEMLGLAGPEDVSGKRITDFFHEDYKEIADLGLEVFAEDETLMFLKLIRQDGQEVEVEIRVSLLDFEGEKSFMLEAHNITNLLRASRALRSREQRLEGILNTVADGIVTIDDRGLIETFNPAAEHIFGFSEKEAIGRDIRALIPDPSEEEAPGLFEMEWARMLASESEAVGKRKGGDTFPVELAIRELRQGSHLSFTGIVRDITARKKAEEKVLSLAHFDQLTGLPNRYLLGDRLDEAIKRAKRHKLEVGLMFIDLDGFKRVNDTFGHAAGDGVLKQIADRIKTCVRNTDSVARVGGDEFVVLLEDIHKVEESADLAQKILAGLSLPFEIDDQTCAVGASIGISIYPEHADSSAGLLDCADKAMYKVKHGEANHFVIYEPDEEQS
jgi:diguanylate cyclase (GGDEF)-like protein/PAS domain S-box-containing protein